MAADAAAAGIADAANFFCLPAARHKKKPPG